MAHAPLQPWPAELQWVQDRLVELYDNNPRYESAWFGWLNSVFGLIFPPITAEQYSIRAQYILRPPIAAPPAGAPPVAVPPIFQDDHLEGPELADPDPDEDDEVELANTSIASHGFTVQGSGQGREKAIRIPDFVVDRAQAQGPRRLVVLVEVKAKAKLGGDDFRRFIRYTQRLQEIDRAGGAVQGAKIMLIAGGQAYVWDYGSWPLALNNRNLRAMIPVAVHSEQFLGTLIAIRNNPQLLV